MIKLRDYRADDYAAVAKNANDPAVVAFLRRMIPSPYTENDAKWWVAEGATLPGTYNQAIEHAGKYAGNIGVVFDANKTAAEIGIWLGQGFWGKGLAKEAVTLFSARVFNEFKIHKLVAHIVVGHTASINLFESCGYQCLGRGSGTVEVHAGTFDCFIYAKYS